MPEWDDEMRRLGGVVRPEDGRSHAAWPAAMSLRPALEASVTAGDGVGSMQPLAGGRGG